MITDEKEFWYIIEYSLNNPENIRNGIAKNIYKKKGNSECEQSLWKLINELEQ